MMWWVPIRPLQDYIGWIIGLPSPYIPVGRVDAPLKIKHCMLATLPRLTSPTNYMACMPTWSVELRRMKEASPETNETDS